MLKAKKVVKPVKDYSELQFLPSVKNASKLKEKDIFVHDDSGIVDKAQFTKTVTKRNARLQAQVDKKNKDKKTK